MGVTPIKVPQSLAIILNSAGEKSGVDFDYLLQTAIRESSLNPTAKASTSSATGLFQFLDSTWLEVMKQEGPRLGYQSYADAIVETSDGDYSIKDKTLRAEVLKLREDPQIAADLAAAFTRNNGKYLEERYGRMPSPGELYIAHFLGSRGAAKLFDAGLKDPDQIAANLFPRQAKANRAIFYEDGKARTIRDVYKALVAKHLTVAPVADAGFTAHVLAADAGKGFDPLKLPEPLVLGGDPEAPAHAALPVVADLAAVDVVADDEGQPSGGWAPRVQEEAFIPSRFGPRGTNDGDRPAGSIAGVPRTLLTMPDPGQGAALFTQLYGQWGLAKP